uniref:Secreted protein n=1 Tax=Anguilla anguilla TaxID=7936 RepID=A0A0E9WUP8_ANGAN
MRSLDHCFLLKLQPVLLSHVCALSQFHLRCESRSKTGTQALCPYTIMLKFLSYIGRFKTEKTKYSKTFWHQ